MITKQQLSIALICTDFWQAAEIWSKTQGPRSKVAQAVEDEIIKALERNETATKLFRLAGCACPKCVDSDRPKPTGAR